MFYFEILGNNLITECLSNVGFETSFLTVWADNFQICIILFFFHSSLSRFSSHHFLYSLRYVQYVLDNISVCVPQFDRFYVVLYTLYFLLDCMSLLLNVIFFLFFFQLV
jgi:hypothetical protein